MTYFIGSSGRVFHDAWLPDGDVERVVVLLHGYGEHLGLYDALARRLTADGCAVHALDALGHGRSDGERAVLDWDVWVDDARRLANIAADRHPGRPVVLIGHSGGGLAAYLLALRSPAIADALVLSGAPLRRQEWIEAALAEPENREGVDADPSELFSTRPEYVHALLHDPLTWHGGFRRESLLAITKVWPEAAAGLAEGLPELPVLFVHGQDDPIVPVTDPWGSAAQLPRARVVTFPGDLHDVLNEHDRDAVHDVVAAFVAECAPVPAPALT
jgi:acylglycerol lipase